MTTAQQKFNQRLGETRRLVDAVHNFVDASVRNSGNYAYACGAMQRLAIDAINELPRARREALCRHIEDMEQKQQQQRVYNTLKDAV